jgi:hypothetical protein
LVNPIGSGYNPERPGYFYIMDTHTGDNLGRVENEYLRFIPWEDESRGGWKQGAFNVTYSNAVDLIAFVRSSEEGPSGLAVTDLEGSFLETKSKYGWKKCIRWVDSGHMLFDLSTESALRVKVWDIEANEVRTFADPEVIGGAVGLHLPDY